MTEERTEAPGDPTREWARALLDSAPWSDVPHRLTVLLVDPPAVPWAPPGDDSTLWLLADRDEVRGLPRDRREALLRDGSVQERPHPEPGAPPRLVVILLDRLRDVLDGVNPRSLEARWSLRHAEVLHDPLGRHGPLAAAALRIPEDGLPRALRGPYLQVAAALGALSVSDGQEATGARVVAAGEAAGALARIACVLEDGTHPPVQWLLPAAQETELGSRLASFLDDLPRAAGGDAAAARRVAAACEPVLRTVTKTLQPYVGGAAWLRNPEAAAFRASR